MKGFQKGNTFGIKGKTKGTKNRITQDVREVFHRVYEGMGEEIFDEKTKEPLNGHQAMLLWARDNPSQFYTLYAKMIPTTTQLPADLHEDFLDTLVLEEYSPKLVEAKDITEVAGEDKQKQLPTTDEEQRKMADSAPCREEIDYDA